MREVEGKHLEQEVRQRLKEIDNLRSKIESLRKGVVATYAERLETRITELFGDRELDPVRLHSEVAILAEKADIAEELVRIQSHQTQFFELLQRPSSGRKMEFLLQEFGREFNTIASKSQNAEIQKLVVNAKFELEKIKEQVANIE